MTKTSTARIITAFDATPAEKIMGRSAAAWRTDFAIKHFGLTGDLTQNKKSPKPVAEVHEREIGKREYRLTLMHRKNNGQLVAGDSIRVGMFGKLLDKPVRQPKPEAPKAPAADPLPELEADLDF